MATYEEKLRELRRKHGLTDGATAKPTPSVTPTYEEKRAEFYRRHGLPVSPPSFAPTTTSPSLAPPLDLPMPEAGVQPTPPPTTAPPSGLQGLIPDLTTPSTKPATSPVLSPASALARRVAELKLPTAGFKPTVAAKATPLASAPAVPQAKPTTPVMEPPSAQTVEKMFGLPTAPSFRPGGSLAPTQEPIASGRLETEYGPLGRTLVADPARRLAQAVADYRNRQAGVAEEVAKQDLVTGPLERLSGQSTERQIDEARKQTTPGKVQSSFQAGMGQAAQLTGTGMEALDLGGVVSEALRIEGERKAKKYDVPVAEWKGPQSLLDPEYWTTTIPRMAGTSAPLMALGAALTVSGAGLAGAAGLSALGAGTAGAVGAAGISRYLEGLMEAGGTFEEAKGRGMTDDQARNAARKVLIDNMKLTGVDAVQFGMAFLRLPKPLQQAVGKTFSTAMGKVGIAIAKVLGGAASEGAEEVVQEAIGARALGDKFDIKSPQAQEAFAGGALMGGVFQAGGLATRADESVPATETADRAAQMFGDIDKAIIEVTELVKFARDQGQSENVEALEAALKVLQERKGQSTVPPATETVEPVAPAEQTVEPEPTPAPVEKPAEAGPVGAGAEQQTPSTAETPAETGKAGVPATKTVADWMQETKTKDLAGLAAFAHSESNSDDGRVISRGLDILKALRQEGHDVGALLKEADVAKQAKRQAAQPQPTPTGKPFGDTVKVGAKVAIPGRQGAFEVMDTKDRALLKVREVGKPDAPVFQVGRGAVEPVQEPVTAVETPTEPTAAPEGQVQPTTAPTEPTTPTGGTDQFGQPADEWRGLDITKPIWAIKPPQKAVVRERTTGEEQLAWDVVIFHDRHNPTDISTVRFATESEARAYSERLQTHRDAAIQAVVDAEVGKAGGDANNAYRNVEQELEQFTDELEQKHGRTAVLHAMEGQVYTGSLTKPPIPKKDIARLQELLGLLTAIKSKVGRQASAGIGEPTTPGTGTPNTEQRRKLQNELSLQIDEMVSAQLQRVPSTEGPQQAAAETVVGARHAAVDAADVDAEFSPYGDGPFKEETYRNLLLRALQNPRIGQYLSPETATKLADEIVAATKDKVAQLRELALAEAASKAAAPGTGAQETPPTADTLEQAVQAVKEVSGPARESLETAMRKGAAEANFPRTADKQGLTFRALAKLDGMLSQGEPLSADTVLQALRGSDWGYFASQLQPVAETIYNALDMEKVQPWVEAVQKWRGLQQRKAERETPTPTEPTQEPTPDKGAVPEGGAAETVTIPTKHGDATLVQRSINYGAGTVIEFGLQIDDTVYTWTSAATMTGATPAAQGWAPMEPQTREAYRQREGKSGRVGARAQALMRLERDADKIIGDAKRRAKEQGQADAEFTERQERLKPENLKAGGYGVKVEDLAVGDVLEWAADKQRYVVGEIIPEGKPAAGVYARPEGEPDEAPGSINLAEHKVVQQGKKEQAELDPLQQKIAELESKRRLTGPQESLLKRLKAVPKDWATKWQPGDGVLFPVAGAGKQTVSRGWAIESIDGHEATLVVVRDVGQTTTGDNDPGIGESRTTTELWNLQRDRKSDTPRLRPVEKGEADKPAETRSSGATYIATDKRIDIKFPNAKAAEPYKAKLSKAGWRFFGQTKTWYHKNTPENLALAKEIAGEATTTEAPTTPQAGETPQKVKATDKSVRDFPTTATVDGDNVRVRTTLAGRETISISFTIDEWTAALRKWPNENYAAREFIRGQFPQQGFLEDGAEQAERIVDAHVNAVKKALVQLAEKKTATPQADKPAVSAGEQEQPKGDKALAERLRKLADGMQNQINQKRNPAIGNQNPTARRARIAAGMSAEADALERVQTKLRALADAAEAGTLPESLQGVKTRTHVETLFDGLRRAVGDANRAGAEKDWNAEPQEKHLQYAILPTPNLARRQIQDLLEWTKDARGVKDARRRVSAVMFGEDADHVPVLGVWDEVQKLLQAAEKDHASDAKWIKDRLQDWKRLKELNLTTPETYQQALRDFFNLGGKPAEPTTEEKKRRQIAESERELIGVPIPGYFPTPKAVVKKMLEAAEIEPGMSVLEPSAGKGNIADQIREQHGDADLAVVEVVPRLRSILEAKDHNLVGSDFMEFGGLKPLEGQQSIAIKTLTRETENAQQAIRRTDPKFGGEYQHETRARATTRAAQAGNAAKRWEQQRRLLANAIRKAMAEGYRIPQDVLEQAGSSIEYDENGNYDPIKQDSGQQYDRIIMNPPFEKGQDVEHVRHAYDLLKPGGRLVSIMSESPFFRSDKQATQFREWLDELGGTSEKLPEGSFKSSERPTGVATRMVVIDKPAEAKVEEQEAKATEPTQTPETPTGKRHHPKAGDRVEVFWLRQWLPGVATGDKRPRDGLQRYKIILDEAVNDNPEVWMESNEIRPIQPAPQDVDKTPEPTPQSQETGEKRGGKEPWQMTREEAIGKPPEVPDPPRPLEKRYGKNWRDRPDAAELQREYNRATSARQRALKAYKEYVDKSNAHLRAVQESIAQGKPVPEKVLAEHPGQPDTKERLRQKTEETLGRDTEAGAIGLGRGPAPDRRRGKDSKTEPFKYDDPEMEAVDQRSRGLQNEPFLAQTLQVVKTLWNQTQREFEHLPRGQKFADLRFKLNFITKKGKGVASDEAAQLLRSITVKMDSNQYDLFRRILILRDLKEEIERQKGQGGEVEILLPKGYTEENITRNLARAEEAAAADPVVAEALKDRRDLMEQIVAEYTKVAKESTGFKPPLDRKEYFRHQVLAHMQVTRAPKGTGQEITAPTKRGFLRRRKGSELDFNHEYIEAEYEVLAQMLYDTEVFKLLKFIRQKYDVSKQLKKAAKQANNAAIQGVIEQELRDLGVQPGEETTAESPTEARMKRFRQLMGMSFGKLQKMAEKGELWEGDKGEWAKTVKSLRLGTKDTDEDTRVFQYLSAVLDEDQAGSLEAATILNAVSERREFIKKTLGSKYKKWQQMLEEGYDLWQPTPGNNVFQAWSLPERMVNEAMEQELESIGVPVAKLRRIRAMGGKKLELAIPTAVAETLRKVSRTPDHGLIDQGIMGAIRSWKVWQLIGPRRVLKYNARNLSGDAEAVFMGNPGGFRKVPKATEDLWVFLIQKKAPSKELQEWLSSGGLQDNLQVAENIGNIKGLDLFWNIMEEQRKKSTARTVAELPLSAIKGLWRASRMATDMREAMLRYANYLHYLEQIQADVTAGGEGRPKNFGASLREEVMALSNIRDRAYKLSNDLLGAYDEVSVFGQWLRDHAFPFWSFQEVNFRRQIKIMRNGWEDGEFASLVGRNLVKTAIKSPIIAYRVGKFALKVMAFSATLAAWNRLFFPDEEDDLPENIKAKPHIVFGRDKDGKVIYFDRLGVLQDFLEWFGLEESPRYVRAYLNGTMSLKEIGADMVKSPLNKVANLFGGPFKSVLEAFAMGKSTFPDVTRMRRIRDPWEHLWQAYSLGEEYRAWRGRPSRGYGRSWSGAVVYRIDPGEAAYWEVNELKAKFRRKKGKGSGYSEGTRTNALYYFKQAQRYGDMEAANKYLLEYASSGGTKDDLKQSVQSAHPMWGLTKGEKREFWDSLTATDQAKVRKAIEFYEQFFSGTGEFLNNLTDEQRNELREATEAAKAKAKAKK